MKTNKTMDIKGYEGLYSIDENGRVLSLRSNKSMKVTMNRGYLVVSLSKDGTKRQYKHHRLIMDAFRPIENSSDFVVNHINGIKDDNRLENLEWCTVEQNNSHAIDTGLNRGKNKLTDEQVFDIKKRIKELQPNTIRFISNKICTEYKVSPRTIESIIVNKRWSNIHI
jgi:hypothetical protein